MGELNRRRALGLLGAGSAAAVLASGLLPGVAEAGPAGGAPKSGPPDAVAATYLRVLLRHTRWAEAQFDKTAGIYPATDFTFAVVLGNALLLTRDGYDAAVAGVDQATLKTHTLDTIKHFAASNLLTGGTEWGRAAVLRHHLPVVLPARLASAVDGPGRGHAGERRAHHHRTGRLHHRAGHQGRPDVRRLDAQRPARRARRRHQARGDGRLRAVPRPGPRLGPR